MLNETPALVSVHNLRVAYGGIEAVKGISLHVHTGELVCLIGSNGAGKTSTLKALAGLVDFSAEKTVYQNQALATLAVHQRLPLGLALVPEGRGVFTRMTVLENLQLGAHWRGHSKAVQREVAEDIEQQWILFPRLAERQHQLAGTLSGGEQQMLAMARALMGRPKLLLLDEPSMGLAPIMVERIFAVIEQVHKQGISVLLVEQNANMALALANRAYVLESGLIALEGPAAVLAKDPRVQQAYLGEQVGLLP